MSSQTIQPDGIYLDQIRDYYSERIRTFGAVPNGVDWGSEQRQRNRFEQLAASFHGDDNFSLLDLGCGYGAFHDYLLQTGKRIAHSGLDLSGDMIAAARQRHPCVPFEIADLGIKKFEYIVARSIFNVMRAASRVSWEAYLRQTLTVMFARACAFNLLATYSDEALKKPDLYYAAPGAILDFCIRNLSLDVNLTHHYGT